jgi:hypothetical protein
MHLTRRIQAIALELAANLAEYAGMRGTTAAFLGLLLMTAAAQAQFSYETNAGSATITGYSGPGGAVAIPATYSNLPVTAIGLNALAGASSVTSISIPDSVTSIGDYAFQDCSSLTNVTIQASFVSLGEEAFSYCANLADVFFAGNYPNVGYDVFAGDNEATAYYLPGVFGWRTNLDTIPALVWNPMIQTGGSLGVSSNQFGFNITGTADIPIVVEACTNLANPVWSPLQAATLANGSFIFSESLQTNSPARYYRISSP